MPNNSIASPPLELAPPVWEILDQRLLLDSLLRLKIALIICIVIFAEKPQYEDISDVEDGEIDFDNDLPEELSHPEVPAVPEGSDTRQAILKAETEEDRNKMVNLYYNAVTECFSEIVLLHVLNMKFHA